MPDVLRTTHLLLSPVAHGDHPALLAHWTGPRVRRHLFDDQVLSGDQVTEIIEASLHDFATEGYGLWTLRARDAPAAELAGVVGLRPLEGPGRGLDVEILYSLEPGRWGQGLAAEAARAVLDHAFDVLALPRVIAEIDEGNAASAEVAERLGMRPCDGRSGDLRHYVAERLRAPETIRA